MEKLPKKKTTGDMACEIGKAIISAIPAAGGPLQVLFENIFQAPLERRKQAWLEKLAEVVDELLRRSKDLTPKKLAEDEVFITVALQASQIAIRNHQQEKVDALRNSVLNSALPNPPEVDQQIIFLRLIDQLTPWHLRVLTFLDNPKDWMLRHDIANPGWGTGGVSVVLEHCFPELKSKQEFYEQLIRDLQTEGLVGQGQFLNIPTHMHGMLQSRTSGMGKRFLKFFSEPK